MERRCLDYPCRVYLDTFQVVSFRMGVMTELVNGTFIEDLSTLLSSCIEGKKLKTPFEIDKEFESMMVGVKSNFVTVDSFLMSIWTSLRQTLIRKIVHVKSVDQTSWIKTEDHITGLLNDYRLRLGLYSRTLLSPLLPIQEGFF